MNINDFPLWTALITPMSPDTSVDFESLEAILCEQEKASNGILILGSTGESLNLCEQERKDILQFTLDLKLKVPLMAGVGGTNLRETLEWVSYLNTLDLHAYLMVTPLYAKPGGLGAGPLVLFPPRRLPTPLYCFTMFLLERESLSAERPSRSSLLIPVCGPSRRPVETPKSFPLTARFFPKPPSTAEMMPFFPPSLPSEQGDLSVSPATSGQKRPLPTSFKTKRGVFRARPFGRRPPTVSSVQAIPFLSKRPMSSLGHIAHPTTRPPLSSRDMSDLSSILEIHKKITDWGRKLRRRSDG